MRYEAFSGFSSLPFLGQLPGSILPKSTPSITARVKDHLPVFVLPPRPARGGGQREQTTLLRTQTTHISLHTKRLSMYALVRDLFTSLAFKVGVSSGFDIRWFRLNCHEIISHLPFSVLNRQLISSANCSRK